VNPEGNSDRRSDLARVRGLGSAKEGVQHWWMQRLTAVALIPLAIWFVASLICQTGASYDEAVAWLSSPVVFGIMVFMIAATFYHAMLGLQVIIEDYVHHEGAKIAALLLMKLACVALALTAIVALLVIAFGR
jgi:succinate dehydrogenase / fumarate reductase membrane anchor subunit